MNRYPAILRMPTVLLLMLLVTLSSLRAVTVTLTVPQATVKPGDTVSVPVSISSAAGFSSIRIQINYHPTLLTLKGVTNDPLGANFRVTTKTNAGTISLLFVRSADLASGSGKLAELLITPKAGAALGAFSDLSVARFDVGNSSGVVDLKVGGKLTALRGRVTVASATAVATPNPIGPTPTPTATPTPSPAARVSQTLTAFEGVTNRVYATNPFTILLPTASSGLGVTVSAAPTNVVSIAGNVVTMKGVGTATLRAVQAGNGNYFGVTNSTNFVISKATQTLTPFVGVTNRSCGTNPFTITLPTASSGLGVMVTASPTNVVSIAGNVVTMKGIGTATLKAVQAGNGNYFGVTNSTNFVISKAAQALTPFVGVTNRFYSPTPFAITPPKASSGLAVAVNAVPTNLVSVSKNMLTMKGVGTATLKAVQAGNGNYFGVTNSTNFVISKAPQTLTAFGGVTNRIYSSKPYVITLPKASSGLGVSVSAVPTSVVSLSGNKVTMKGVGTATLTAVQAGNANYQGVTNSVSFVISPKK
jgi:hypothetical protein